MNGWSSRSIGVLFGALCLLPAAGLGAPAVALPAMQADLGVTLGASSWVLAAYSLAASVGMVLTGRILERRGARLILILSSVGLVAGAMIAAFATSLAIVVVARLLLGLAAAGLLTTAYASVGVLKANDRTRALATIGAAVGVGSACGPLIGGLLVAILGWRAVIVSPVVSAILLPQALRALPAERPDRQPRLDYLGAALLIVLGAATVGLLESRPTRLDRPVVITLGVTVALTVAGLLVQTRLAACPFVPRHVLQVRGFVAACLAGAASYAGYFALLFAAPLLLTADGYNSALIGLLLLPSVIGSIGASRFGRMAGSRIGVPWTVAALGAITVGAMLLAPLTGGATIAVVLAMMIGIAGFAGAQVVFLAAINQAVPARDTSVATGLYNFVAFIGGALGPACVGAFAVTMPLSSALAPAAILPATATALALAVVVRRCRAGVTTMRI